MLRTNTETSGIQGKFCEQGIGAAVSLLAMFVANNITGFGHV